MMAGPGPGPGSIFLSGPQEPRVRLPRKPEGSLLPPPSPEEAEGLLGAEVPGKWQRLMSVKWYFSKLKSGLQTAPR